VARCLRRTGEVRSVGAPLAVALLCLAAACDGEVPSTNRRAGPGDSGGDLPPPVLPDGSPPPTGGGDAGGGPPPPDDPPEECDATDLSDAVVSSTVGTPGRNGETELHAAATEDGGAVVAWAGSDGVHLTRVDRDGAPTGNDAVVSGVAAWAVAASEGQTGVLVQRGEQTLALVVVGTSGETVLDHALIGSGGRGGSWGRYIRAARLRWVGSRWAAYFTVYEGGHYGDSLRYLARDGTEMEGGWDWGCSHSMDVRIGWDGSEVAPVCVSDCFPEKGVLVDARTMLFRDPTGDCSGGTSTSLGGVAPAGGGFLVGLESSYGRSSADVGVLSMDGGGGGSVQWLTEDSASDTHLHLAPFGGALVAGWVAGGRTVLARLSATGTMQGSPEEVPGPTLEGASDFFLWANGDVGWAAPAGSDVEVARLRDCP